jgi:hypothetical protein
MSTSTLAVDGLPEDHELHHGGFLSATRRRTPEEVGEVGSEGATGEDFQRDF